MNKIYEEMNFLSIEDAFFNNILLLGIECETIEKKYGCLVNKNMFKTPNKKGMEIILHFLLSKTSPELKEVLITKLDY